MSTITHDIEVSPEPQVPPPTTGKAWHVTWHGVRTVATLELRQRVRSTRWIAALVVWFVVVGGITLLTSGAIGYLAGSGGSSSAQRGPLLFGAVVILVLGLGLLVTPTLSSTSINGDRNGGTLATLQVTLLSPAEIVLGKLLASWTASLAFLAASLPFLLLALLMGGTAVASFVVVLLLVAVLLACVCAIGLGFSALVSRTAGSTVLTFLTVAALTVIAPILFAVTLPTVSSTSEVRVWATTWEGVGEDPSCQWETVRETVVHTERTWWLLGANPFVVVADGAAVSTIDESTSDPFAGIRTGIRYLRAGPQPEVDRCWNGEDSPVEEHDPDASPVWPWGLGVNVLLGAAGVVTAVRRLHVPQRKLARGTRVA
ncbi:ABC transporter permease [Cellulomonas chengniuliangii]|uniref:ABC transporter permease n=1 Tax=Cellulomonas chengniuliangii TaxID=2968084 RepID=A0ABY5KYY0_9CELL|nr:ABC transporter permease [Cellulomonas chengniuliangii]MCC2309392.1 ABC transporter permease [Cellulomonas chengniuliangii]MCC2316663.1 ABC transporter permease [Cellulomonas chengniuliangii]UUI75043.1 ABC transporter permease [Cellulomonas chengniuliangii]